MGWIRKSEPGAILAVQEELRAALVVLPRCRCTAGLVAGLRKTGAAVWAWDVNDAAAAQRLVERGVEGLITDAPARLVAWRDGRGPQQRAPGMGRQGS